MTISIRTVAGAIIDNLDSLFGETIFVGSGTYTARFRIYNNYSGVADQNDLKDLKVYLTGTPKMLTAYELGGIGLEEWATSFPYIVLRNEYFSGVCKVASKQFGANPLLESGTINYEQPFDDVECDYIYASGSDNFNEYELTINIPSGVNFVASSGSVYITLKYKYV